MDIINLPPLEIGGIALLPIVVAVIGILKSLGVSGKWLPSINGVLSVGAYFLTVFTAKHPETVTPVTQALNAILYFLMSAGIYDLTKRPAAKIGDKLSAWKASRDLNKRYE